MSLRLPSTMALLSAMRERDDYSTGDKQINIDLWQRGLCMRPKSRWENLLASQMWLQDAQFYLGWNNDNICVYFSPSPPRHCVFGFRASGGPSIVYPERFTTPLFVLFACCVDGFHSFRCAQINIKDKLNADLTSHKHTHWVTHMYSSVFSIFLCC